MSKPIDEYDEIAQQVAKCSPLSTKGLILVPASEDIADYSRWLNDPDVVKFSELRHRQHTYEDCQAYVRSFDQIKNCMWTINVIGANMHIGNITTHHDPQNDVLQMGILIGEKWAWGRKYGIEAWQAVMAWAVENKIRRIEAGCMAKNLGIRKVIERSGMELAANMPGHFKFGSGLDAKYIYKKDLAA